MTVLNGAPRKGCALEVLMARFFRSRFRVGAFFAGLVALLAAPLAMAGMHRGMGHGFGPPSPERMAEHASFMMDRMADHVDADEAQRAELERIVDEAVAELTEVHAQGAEVRDALREAVVGGADAAEVEALRQEAIGQADAVSQVMLGRVLAVRDVLTPEQWSKVVAMHEARGFGGPGEHGERGRHGDHGRHHDRGEAPKSE